MNTVGKYLFVAALATSLMNGGTAFGATDMYYSKVFDATTEITDAKGTQITSRTVSDGKGHVKTESKNALGSSITVLDYPNKTQATLMETAKVIVKSPLAEPPRTVEQEASFRKDVKSLGNKTIEGHPCRGESYSMGQSKMEVWTGTDINYPVKSVVDQGGGTITTLLKAYSTKAPPVKEFQLPMAGYKIMEQQRVAK